MISPERLKNLPDNLVRLWAAAEADIIADMAGRISARDMFIPAVAWQFEQTREMGFTYSRITEKLAPLVNKTKEELSAMITAEVGNSMEDDGEIFASAEKAGLIKHAIDSASSHIKEIINAGIEQTNGEFENLTQTTAQLSSREFLTVLDRAWLKVATGAFSREAAVTSAVKELADMGLKAFQYESGRSASLDAAVRRAVVTGVNQTAGKVAMQRCVEMNCDLVEVTAHEGARTGEGVANHAGWQGKVYSISGKNEKYPSLYEKTGLGTVQGLLGVNCRHSFFPFFEGISERAYTDDELAALDAPKYEWEGKRITEEEANRLRRQYEQTARKWNRETKSFSAAAWKAMDAGNETLFFDMSNSAAYAQNKLKQWKDRLSELNAATGGKTDTSALSAHNVHEAEKVKPGAMQFTRKMFEENIEKAQTVRQFINRVATLAVWLKDKALAEGKTEQEAIADGFKALYEYADKKDLTPNEQQTLTRMFIRNTAYYLKDAGLKEELLSEDVYQILSNEGLGNQSFFDGNGLTVKRGSDTMNTDSSKFTTQMSKRINEEKTNRHRKDAREYAAYVKKQEGKNMYGPSYVYGGLEDIQKLVDKYSGTGEPSIVKGEWQYKEYIQADAPIGVAVDPVTGEEHETNCFTIHYSKTGTHVVPRRKPEGGTSK